ncbi:MAG: S9 family peptidase [Spirosomataceae bacterium]
MRKSFYCFILVFCTTHLVFSQTKQDSLTIEKAIARYQISSPHLSPDEKKIAFVVREPIKGNTTPNSDIWIYEIETKALFQLTRSPKSDNNPKWSPDSKSIAFLSARGSENQVYLIKFQGGEAFPITKSKTPVSDFEWSPDGKQIAYLAPEPATEEEEKRIKEQNDETTIGQEKPTRLWLLDVETQTATQKTLPNAEISELKWLPNGESLAFLVNTLPKTEADIPALHVFNLKTNTSNVIATPKHAFWGRLKISTDGKSFGYVGARTDGPSSHDLFLQKFDADVPENITATKLDLPINEYLFLSGGKIMFACFKGFQSRIYTISDNKNITPYPINQNVGAFDVSSNGTIAFTSFTITKPEELWLALPNNQPIQITNFNKVFDSYHFQAPEFITYKSFDGKTIEGVLFKPANSKGKVPLATLIHGGPTGAWTDSYNFWQQVFVSRGYAVFCPNIRGSLGYGWDFVVSNRNDWGGGDFKDMMAGIDFLVQRGGIDENRLGIAGWSYGGYMAMWAVTQTNRFKAAIAGAGMSDLASEYGTENGVSYDRWFFGTPYENLANFTKSSPITFIKNAKTPTLIIQGEKDAVDPVGQSQQFYRGLRHYGVTTELVLYPREPHGFREEKHIIDYTKRMLDWFDKYVK